MDYDHRFIIGKLGKINIGMLGEGGYRSSGGTDVLAFHLSG